MSNPVFNNSAVFGPRAGQGGRQAGGVPVLADGPGQYGQFGAAGAQAADAATLDAMYSAPSATTADTRRLTYDDVIIKTSGLLVLLVAAAAASWTLAADKPGIWMIAALVGFGLGLANSFKRNPSPVLIALYALAEGVFLGGISRAYEAWHEGVVVVAVIATVATFSGALALFSSGKVRVTGKFVKWLLVAMTGYLIFSLLNLVLVWTGVLDGWGMRSGGLGILVGLFAVGLAAASLIVDFDSIKRGVTAGVPVKYAWSAAFGLIVTLIWLYLEFMRLAAIVMGRD